MHVRKNILLIFLVYLFTGISGVVAKETLHKCLKIEQGDFIDAIVFQRKFAKSFPNEDSIVLTSPSSASPTTALVIYSEKGKIWIYAAGTIHPFDESDYRLFDDINSYRYKLEQFWALPALPAVGTPEEQLRRAYTALSTVSSVGVVPVSLKIDQFPDEIGYPREQLFFDWSGAAYAYHPSSGVRRYEYPVDKVTGEPYLCITGGDLFECKKFYFDYLRIAPGERSAFLFKADNSAERSFPCVVYSKAEALYLFNPWQGHIRLEDRFSLSRPDEIHDWFIRSAFDKIYIQNDVARLVPQSLPGDTGKRQAARAFLNSSGHKIFEILGENYYYGFRFGTHCFYYHSGREVVYHGHFSPFQISALVENILFSIDYLREHEGEQVFIYNRPESLSAPRRAQSVAVYTQSNKVFMYSAIVGSVEIPASLTMLEKSRHNELFVMAQKAHRIAYKWQKPLRTLGVPFTFYDADKMSVANVFKSFLAAGIDVHKVPLRIRSEDGSMSTYPADALIFSWEGIKYTYSPEFGAYRTPGYFWPIIR